MVNALKIDVRRMLKESALSAISSMIRSSA